MSRVLVVDDEEAYRTLMAGHLERKGMQVATAANGAAALDAMQAEGPFNVVVTDLMMPNMSGLELLKELKSREPGTEVIIITASNEIDKAVSAMRDGGAFDYLLKPLESIGELSLTVGRAIQHQQLVEERQRLAEELDREASLLQALVTYSGEAMLLVDGSGEITIANPAAMELLENDALVGQNTSEVLPAELITLVDSWQGMGVNEPSVVEIDWPSTYSHLVSIAPLGFSSEEQSGWVMILRDISHLKQIDDLKLRMLNDAAGKIRLPLAEAMSKLADLSTGEIQEEDARNTTVYQLATILGRIQEWIDELLTLVQVEAGVGFSTEVLSLGDVIDEALKSRFEEMQGAKGLHLDLSIPADLPAIRVDPKLFERMLHGLLARAAQRSQTGGVVGINARAHAAQVWIELSDQGLPSVRLEQSEESFLEDSRQGFNLQMVRTIVQKLGGQVWVRGQDRIGSTIAIALPTVDGVK